MAKASVIILAVDWNPAMSPARIMFPSVTAQLTGVAVQGAVGVGVEQQRGDGLAELRKGPQRVPLRLEDVQAHLARLPVDVRVKDLGHEVNFWR